MAGEQLAFTTVSAPGISAFRPPDHLSTAADCSLDFLQERKLWCDALDMSLQVLAVLEGVGEGAGRLVLGQRHQAEASRFSLCILFTAVNWFSGLFS